MFPFGVSRYSYIISERIHSARLLQCDHRDQRLAIWYPCTPMRFDLFGRIFAKDLFNVTAKNTCIIGVSRYNETIPSAFIASGRYSDTTGIKAYLPVPIFFSPIANGPLLIHFQS